MKRIIIFRHGEYDGSGELDADGAKAVFARAKLIRRETGRAATVFTSPVLRCRQTARVIALAMDGAETEGEELLAENCSDRAHECKNRLIALAERQDGDTIAAVSHAPNIRQMFNVGLRPGSEIMFEADDWRQIFDRPAQNLISRVQNYSEEYFRSYFMPECGEEDLAKLRSLDFLAGRL